MPYKIIINRPITHLTFPTVEEALAWRPDDEAYCRVWLLSGKELD